METFALTEHFAILGDVRTTGEYDICRGLAYARGSVYIAAVYACALLRDHLTAESVLAYHAVGTREVEDQLRALDGQLGRWRQRTPEVLAYLYTKGVVTGGEEQVGSKRHFSTPYLDLRNARGYSAGRELPCRTSRGEPTFLVELTGVRQVHFRHYAHNFAIRHHEGAVEEVVIHFQRRTDEHYDRLSAGVVAQRFQLTQGALLKRLGEEQVRTSVARKTQLRKTNNLYALRNRLVNLLTNLLGVVLAIRYA